MTKLEIDGISRSRALLFRSIFALFVFLLSSTSSVYLEVIFITSCDARELPNLISEEERQLTRSERVERLRERIEARRRSNHHRSRNDLNDDDDIVDVNNNNYDSIVGNSHQRKRRSSRVTSFRGPAHGRDNNDDDDDDGDETAASASVDEDKQSEEDSAYLISAAKDKKCIYGYTSTSDESTCVCNTDWIGESCDIDPIPSCDRNVYLSCGDVLYHFAHSQKKPGLDRTEFPTCQCVDECASYLLSAYGASMYNFTLATKNFGRFDANKHVCTEKATTKYSLYLETNLEKRKIERDKIGEVSAENQEEYRKLMLKLVDYEEHNEQNKATDCSPSCEKSGGKCINFECASCKEGRFGMDCVMSKEEINIARKNASRRKIKNELSISIADLPGTIKRFVRGREYANHGSYRGVHFFEDSLRIDVEVFDPAVSKFAEIDDEERKNGVLLIPFFASDVFGNVGQSLVLTSRVAKYVKDTFKNDVNDDLPFTTLWLNGQDRAFCTSLTSRTYLPSNAIAITCYGAWRGGSNDESPCFLKESDIVIPASVASGQGYYGEQDPNFERYNVETKDGFLLFFLGGVRSRPECLGQEFFENLEKNCMYAYSGAARGWIIDKFGDDERMWLNRNLVHSVELGEKSAQAEKIRNRSKFCLAAGGNGWDSRFVDSISRGCVPVLTQINYSHPFDFLLDYESFTILAPGEKMRRLPEILEEAVSSGKYAKMLKNLRVVREVMAWNVTKWRDENDELDTFTVNNGAYYHTLAAIAVRTKKDLPGIVAEKLCKLYFENAYHATAGMDILRSHFREILEPRCKAM